LPKNLQGWYDGHTRTTITRQAGSSIAHGHLTYLIYNRDAFRGRALKFPSADGQKQCVNDIYWYGHDGV